MYGSHIGSLIIYTQKSNVRTEVQRLTGEQGNFWLQLAVDIDVALQAKESLRIIVEGTVGDSYEGDISVDDIAWAPSLSCSAAFTTTTAAPITPVTYRK